MSTDVGGDWYDVIELADGSAAVALGDVMGKGTTAAILMSEMRAALRAYAVLDPAPATVLARMDELGVAQPVNEQLIMLAYGLVSPDRRTLRLALAGHPPPLVVARATGPSSARRRAAVPPSAWAPVPGRRPRSTSTPAATCMLYSDGLVETREPRPVRRHRRAGRRTSQPSPRDAGSRGTSCTRLADLMATAQRRRRHAARCRAG